MSLQREWGLALAWLLGSVVAAQVLKIVWTAVLIPIARRTRTALDLKLLEQTLGPAQWTVFAALLNMGAHATLLRVPGLSECVAWAIFRGVCFSLLAFALTAVVYATTHALVEWYSAEHAHRTRSSLDDRFAMLYRRSAKFVFGFIALTVVLDHFGIQISGLVATAGVASLAVAFAAQETLSNMIAGFVLLVDRPFKAGDRIELSGGKMGDVIDVGLRTTKILAFDNTVITIPNAEISKSQIVNISAPDANYKIRATIGVAYGSDLREVKTTLLGVLSSHGEVLKDPPPAVYFTEFGDSSLNLLYVCWVADYREQFRIRDELNMAIYDAFAAASIRIPFPQRDIHVFTERA